MDLKLKDLRYLVAVADTRHFGRAAERSFVSQPTLSAQLKKLEEYLGVQLIERAPKRVPLTPAGEEIVERARRILEASDEIVELARSHRDPLAGRLRLALLPTIGPYLLPNVARQLRKQLPRLELMLYEYQTDLMLEKLHSGEIDVGILALPVDSTGCESRELYKEPFTVAMPAHHGWRSADHQGGRPGPRNAAAARRRPLPARPGARHLRRHRHAREAGFPRHQPRDAAADGGLRRGHHAAARARRPRRLRQCARRGAAPFAKPVPDGTIGAVWRKTTAREAAIAALCKLIMEHAQ